MHGPFFCVCVGLCLLQTVAIAEQPAAEARRPGSTDTSDVIAKFRVARHGDLLVLPVSIRGEEHQFILDTGAMGNVLNVSLVEKLAPLKRSARKYPAATPPMYEFPEATLAGTDLAIEGDAAKLDLQQIGRMSGYNVQGILGMNSLNGRVIEIDFDAGTVTFLKVLPANTGKAIPLGRDAVERLTVGIEIQPGTLTPFIIDTGMSAPGIGEMTPVLFDALLKADRIKLIGPSPRVITVEGVFIARKGEIDVFKVGDFEHRNLRITSGRVNAIGLRYLSRYKITLDLIDDRMFLEPCQRFAASPVFDASGMIVSRIEGETLVEKVHPNGPAASAGIRAGDVVIRVNGLAVNEDSLFTLRQALSRSNHTVTLSIRRLEEDLEFHLALKNWQAILRKP